jgi:hypothetical protein
MLSDSTERREKMNESRKKDRENYCFGYGDYWGFKGNANSRNSDDSKKCSCISACRWFPIFPVVLGIAAIAAGYVLSPSTIKTIWLALSMAMAGFDVFALVMMRTMTGKSKKI